MLGIVTAMETFCGQAFGARRYHMVGVVLQRGLAISLLYCCCTLVMWHWCEALLVYTGQVRLRESLDSFFNVPLCLDYLKESREVLQKSQGRGVRSSNLVCSYIAIQPS